MDLEKTVKKYEVGEINLSVLKQELRTHRDELAKGLQDAGLAVTARTEERSDKLASAGLWMRDLWMQKSGHPGAREATERLARWGIAKANMAEGSTATGGAMVPSDLQPDLFEALAETSVVMPGATIYQMRSDQLKVPATLTQGAAHFHKEAESIDAGDPAFREITLNTVRLDGYTTASNELLEDSAIDAASVLLRHYLASASQAVDSAVFNTNESAAFSGVFTADGAGYSVVLGTGSSLFSNLVVSSLMELVAKFPTYVTKRGGGKVFMSPTVWSYLAKQQLASTYLMNPYTTSGPASFYGMPIVLSDQAPSSTAVSTGFVVIGFTRNLIVGDRRAMSIVLDPYTNAASYQTRIIAVQRLALANGSTSGWGRVVTAAS